MLIPAISRYQPRRLETDEAYTIQDSVRPLSELIGKTGKRVTAKPKRLCAACKRGVHECVSRNCSCERCWQ